MLRQADLCTRQLMPAATTAAVNMTSVTDGLVVSLVVSPLDLDSVTC